MFEWANDKIAQFEPTAISYVENLTLMGGALAVIVGVLAVIYYVIVGWFKNGDPTYNDGIVYLKIISKTSAAFALPTAPALAMSVFYPGLLGNIEGIQPPLVFAAFGLIWASIRAFKE